MDALQELVDQISAGTLHVQIGKTFHLDQIVEAHRCVEENKAGGKIVVNPSLNPSNPSQVLAVLFHKT